MAAIYTGGNGAGWGYAQGNSYMYYGGNGSGYGNSSMSSDTYAGYNSTATQLAFTTSPSNSYAGAAFGTQPVVAIEDVYGNTVLNATSTVTLSINTDPVGGSTLGGTASMAAASGVANFSGKGVYVSRAGNGYALSAAASGLTPATSSLFNSLSPIQVSYPDGGEVLTVSTPYNITWNTYGVLATGANTAQYSLNNGSTWTTLSTNATSPLSWVTPSNASTQALVKISNSADSTFIDTSASTFSLLAGFTMIAPNGGEIWANGFAHTISWSTKGTVADVKLEYSADDGSTWNTITASTANSNQYAWTPAVSSGGGNYLVRVSDASNSLSSSTSAAVFTVQKVVITSPTSGTRFQAGTSNNITWTSAAISNVNIQYTTNGGSSWTTIASNVSAALGSYSWSVPSNFTTSTNVQVRITSTTADSDGNYATNTSSAFAVYGVLAITAPNGSEQWAANGAHLITWNSTAGAITNVKLEYSADNFVSDLHTIVASTSNTGSYSWTPTVTGTTFKVRVSDAQDSQAYSVSASYFSVTGIGITAPAAAANWACGSSQTITWNYTGSFTTVDISYYNGSSWQTIATAAPNTGSYSWNPVPLTPTNAAQVKVQDHNSSTSGTSGVFNIPSVLDLTYPNGGQTLNVGSAYNITWTITGTVADVKLEYSTDNSSTWNTIAASTSNTGSYNWTVPNGISSQALVRVSDVDAGHPAASSQSASDFTIQSNMAVTAPVALSSWAVGETHTITWTNTGTVGSVNLYYSYNAGSTWTAIATGVANGSGSGNYSWTLPDILLAAGDNPQTTPSQAVEIKVVDATSGHPATTAVSSSFNVIYYTTTWTVDDSQTHGPLAQLSVSDTSGWSASSLSSGVTRNYPYGTYSTIWSKTNYVDSSYVNWTANQNQTLTVNMVPSSIADAAYNVYSNFTYDANSNSYLINSWLEQAGAIVTSPASCTITIMDANDHVVSTLSSSSPDANGVFRNTWSLSGLNANSSYLGKAQVTYQGNTYSANAIYSISVPLVATVQQVTTLTGAVNNIATSVGSNLTGQVSALQTTANTISTSVGSDLAAQVSTLETTANDVLTSVGSGLTGQVTSLQSGVTDLQTTSNAILNDVKAVQAVLNIINGLNTYIGTPEDPCGLLTLFGQINCTYQQEMAIPTVAALAKKTYAGLQQLQQQAPSNTGSTAPALPISPGVVQTEISQISKNVQAARQKLEATASAAGLTNALGGQAPAPAVTLDDLRWQLMELKQLTQTVKDTVLAKEGPLVKAWFANGGGKK